MILQAATPKSGEDPGGGAPGALPPKFGKDVIFLRKTLIFHTKYPKKNLKCAPPNLKSWIRP